MADPSTAGGPSALPRRGATIYDVARVAGVSHQSVSRYVRGLDMRAATKVKIEAAIATLDYKPNLSARALITGRSTRIGALTHEAHQYGPAMVIQGATAAARQAGYLLDVVSLDMGDVTEIGHAIRALTQYDLAGIVAFASTDGTRQVFEETRFDVPVIIASETDEPETLAASRAATRGIDEAIGHLQQLGHTSFLHIAGPEDWAAARNRLHAFRSSIDRRGLHVAGVRYGDWSAKSGYDAIATLGDEEARVPTAIVAANDQMALGAMYALRRRGLDVPRDVSVTGLDDTPDSAYFTPALTTIRVDFQTEGREAVEALLAVIDPGETAAVRTDDAPGSESLVVRDSTAVAPPRPAA
ncbi:substrate-binding domain-containing protein [Microbacterium sp. X-17]|uniref:LacI family DNA-binding transcriptional regulator n=1 Tax=Microbacterium sp. X-17 TaxID=3144404 RepID=UPI0031F5C6E5